MKNIFIVFVSLLLFAQADAQEKTDTTKKIIHLNEFIYSANKAEEKKSDVPYTIEVIDAKTIELSNPQTSADMLQNSGSVFVQKSQQGGGSPVLRGFEANKVLIVIDGIRMNNAIYRSGHLQDVITLDNSMLDRTEVVFGPSSVIYGSDALGGVMHFFTKNPKLADSTRNIGVNLFTRYSSVNNESTSHIDLNYGFKKVAFLSSLTHSAFGDLRSGSKRNPFIDSLWDCRYFVERVNSVDSMVRNSDSRIQRYSGYRQTDFMQKILFQQSDNITHKLNFQYSISSNVPRYDRLQQWNGTTLRYAEWNYGPQKRLLGAYILNIRSEAKLFDNFRLTVAYQDIDQERITRRFGKTIRTNQKENVKVYSVNADFIKVAKEKHEIRYGIESCYNDVSSSATDINIINNTENKSPTRYPDGGSSTTAAAAYFTHSYELNEKIIFSEGIRFSYISLEANWADTALFHFPFTSAKMQNSALNGSLGIVTMPGKGWRFGLMGSSGFRAPNVDDMGKVNESTSGNLIVPNTNLKPELAYNGEISIWKSFESKVKIEMAGFYTLLQHAIVVKDSKFNGADSVFYDGSMSKVQTLQNADEAYIYGIAGNFLADFNDNFSFKSSLTWTYGRYRDISTDTIIPLDHIPPVFGQTALIHRGKKTESEFYVRYNGWKHLKDYSPSGEDNLPQATAFGMPSWYTLNCKVAYAISGKIKLIAGVENIADVQYRTFASGINAGGRNFFVTARGSF